MELRYQGFAYRQTNDASAPWLVSFVAPAEELLEWAGIPRRTESVTWGFQRPEAEARVSKAKEFFELSPNQSPTALVVGIHPPTGPRRVELQLGAEISPGGSCRKCELVVKLPDSGEPLAAVVELVKTQLGGRMTPEEAADAGGDDVVEPEDAIEVDDNEEQAGDDESAEDGLELGSSLIPRLLKQLSDATWVAQNEETIRDLAKPATIIDGQHRVMGAASCERKIPFSVCAMFDCSWPEQVFQFTVVNYSAKGIPDQFITANAALSLTGLELSRLQTRLIQAKVKVVEYELMKVVEFEAASPFYNLVNLTEKSNASKIGYKTMVQTARLWYSATAPLKDSLLPRLYPDIKGRGSSALRLHRWREEDWGLFFLDFWSQVRDYYKEHKSHSGHSLWTVGGSNLMQAVVLLEFARMHFQDLCNQDDDYYSVPDNEDPLKYLRGRVANRASKFLAFYPPDFFGTEWLMKSLNISSGKKTLTATLKNFLDKKGKYQYARSPLITGETV